MRIIEVECDTLEQVAEARDAGADIVMLDNMSPDEVRKAVEMLDGRAPRSRCRAASTLDTVGAYAETGADFISVGALTHSARALDIGLDIALRSPLDMLLAIDAGNTQTVVGLFRRRTSSSTTGASRPTPTAPPTSSR